MELSHDEVVAKVIHSCIHLALILYCYCKQLFTKQNIIIIEYKTLTSLIKLRSGSLHKTFNKNNKQIFFSPNICL